MSAQIGDVVVISGPDGSYVRHGTQLVPGIPRATLLRWACEEINDCGGRWESENGIPRLRPLRIGLPWCGDTAAAALLLCEAIGTDEADSEEWG
ncbi:MAG TPA: hypothetical protein PK948_05000 [Gemmatimonadales bacterium]|nr:hypothetical protein [Gemmatimonadales bacterium]